MTIEETEDCISRKALLDEITEIDYGCNMDIFTNEVREIVNELPSIQPKTDVLAKIRAEIQEVYYDRPRTYNHSQRTELFCEVMKIIDKYKAESEE